MRLQKERADGLSVGYAGEVANAVLGVMGISFGGASVQQHAVGTIARAVERRLETLGIKSNADLEAFWKLVRVRDIVYRGRTIVGQRSSHFTLLLEGIACTSTPQEDGGRQIHAFHHPGDFLGLDGLLFTQIAELSEVQALTNCSIGTIDRDALERVMGRHPALGGALWRAAMVEIGIFRQRLVISRRPALQRVAHLLCEQMARLGIDEGVIPLTQVEVADAAGLSVVHINRVFQELRQLGLLSQRRLIEIVDSERLKELAAFEPGYLDSIESLSQWDLRIDD